MGFGVLPSISFFELLERCRDEACELSSAIIYLNKLPLLILIVNRVGVMDKDSFF